MKSVFQRGHSFWIPTVLPGFFRTPMRWYGWTVWPRAAWDVVWSFEAYHGVPHFLKSSRWNMITFGHVIALGVHLRFFTQKMEAMARWSRWFTFLNMRKQGGSPKKTVRYQRVYAVIGGSSCYSLQLIIIGICAGILRLGSRNHGQFTNIKAELNKWRVALDREGLL